jgi:PAS domain S-box-containing protein
MSTVFRFMDWPLRAKLAALLVVASVIPLGVAAFTDIREARQRLLADTAALLAARGDQLVGQLDTFHRSYQRSVDQVAHLPDVVAFCQARPEDTDRFKSSLRTALDVWPASDANIRGIAILDASGTVKIATEDSLIGKNLSYHSYIREALRGVAVISDIHLAGPEVGDAPTIAYLAPVRGPDRTLIGLAAFWVRATALWDLAKASNELAGPSSFAVLFDHQGIRIAHTYNQDIVFHPGGQLDAATVAALVAEQRFGTQTRALLDDVRTFPEQFDRARAESPDPGLFRGFAPVNQQWNYGVGRRLVTVPWTVFYMIPEASLNVRIAELTWAKTIFAGVIILVALIAGTLCAVVILRPIRSLARATESIAGGDLAARVPAGHADELGQLGSRFNAMAEQIEAQATALQSARDELELRVQERTAALVQTTQDLEVEIADRRRAEEAVRESQRLLRAIVESSDDAIISKTLDGVITSWNPGAERLFGFLAPEAIGKPMLMLIPPERAAEEPQILARIARGENVDHFETVRWRKDGSRIHISATISPIRDGHGRIIGASKIARDITERKQAEHKLQAHLERLNLLHQITRAIGERQDLRSILQVAIRSLEDQLPIDFCCVCHYDPASNVLTVMCVGLQSETLARELAMTEHVRIAIDQNGLSQCVQGQLVYEPDISQVAFSFPQRLAQAGLRSLVVAPLLVERQVFGVLVAARREAHSFSSGECEFLRQLSEHVALAAHQAQLYGALQQAYDDLRQTQQAVLQQERLRALGQMASGIAHDINNAISPIALYTESLLETELELSTRARTYLQTIQRAIDDVAATVARMREFYRPREAQVLLMPVQLNLLVQQVVDLTRARWSDMPQQRGVVIQLLTELAPDLPAIMGIESELREALTNLIFNSVDAMPDGGTLTLRTHVADHAPGSDAVSAARSVQLEVADTGVGMDEDTRRRCLEPFFTTKGERGTGLGLAMLYGVVQRHSAELDIDSAVGTGTTVRLHFAVPSATVEPAQPAMAYTAPSRLRILVVDDDPLLLQSLRDTLETEGHMVTTANSGQGGIDGFRAACERGETFTVVITDLGMPYVDRVLAKPPKLRDLRMALAHCCTPTRA